MEIVEFAKEVLQNAAEHVASYRLGQTALRHLDRALWVVEKCARWAVPPPLDIDERPQPELVRPLPWVFFLALLITLRVTRESISIINLFMGKPPLRSADVVMYIQSKRRYLRTLKYQGNRMMRARSAAASTHSWPGRLRALLDGAMCFRGSYGNNNTMRHSNNDEVLVVKRSKRGRQTSSPIASTSESTMERLIERMMVDLDADSDDSSFTLTNVTSVRSDHSETTESEHETVKEVPGESPIPPDSVDINTKDSQSNEKKEEDQETKTDNLEPNSQNEDMSKADESQKIKTESFKKPYSRNEKKKVEQKQQIKTENIQKTSAEDAVLMPPSRDNFKTPGEESQTLLYAERDPFYNSERKVANGQITNSTKREDQSEDLRGTEP